MDVLGPIAEWCRAAVATFLESVVGLLGFIVWLLGISLVIFLLGTAYNWFRRRLRLPRSGDYKP